MKFVYFVGILIFNFWAVVLFKFDRFFDGHLPQNTSYDYIIVGSGSAGSIIGANLKGKVLLIEAGGNGNNFLFNIPIVQPLLQASPFDWSYKTERQENACKALHDQRSNWPMGKIIGGTNCLNNMVYHRGHPSDYESFIDNAEKWFQEYEKQIPISQTQFISVAAEAFIDAGRKLGFDDFSFTNLTQLHGRRFSHVDILRCSAAPPEILTNAYVTRLLFSKDNPKKAVGLEFEKRGKLHKVFGNSIILSAGTIGSAKILLHSGIGPKEHLKSIGIDVREDLPVGENLQDHLTTAMDLILLNQTVGLGLTDLLNPWKIIKYFLYKGDGPFALGGADAMGFTTLNKSSNIPDLSFMLLPVGLIADHGIHLRKIINLRDDVWENYFKPIIGQTTISILPILLHPKSRGTVKLNSKNYKDPPLINPNYLQHPDDIKKLITGIRILQKFIETQSMKSIGAEINPKPFPGCESFIFDSNQYWECYIRHMTLTMYHPIGTCKIGAYDDPSTVVLKNFQVKHIENLFVLDGSILPQTPSANPHSIIAMMAQKFVYDMSEAEEKNKYLSIEEINKN